MNSRWAIIALMCSLFMGACTTVTSDGDKELIDASKKDADNFLIVDCLLPGKVRKLGGQFSYITARHPVKASASNCEIRGGEYTAYDRADYSTALKIWLPLAKQGDAEAQSYVGEIYEKGLGLVPDFTMAAYWYKKASDQQLARAQINLGHLYEKGLGVKINIATALELYRMASGLTSDQLTFSSSLQASYVPREQFHAVRQELLRSEQQQAVLEKQINQYETQLALKNKNLIENEQNLITTQAQLQALILNPPLAVSSISNEKEQQLLGEIESLDSQRIQLENQISNIEKNVTTITHEKEQLETQLSESIRTESQYREQVSLTQLELDNYSAQLKQSQQEVTKLQNVLHEQKTNENVVTATNQTEVDSLEKILNEKNTALTLQQKQYNKLLKQHQNKQTELSSLTNELDSKDKVLNKQLANFKQQQTTHQKAIDQKELELRSVSNQLKNNQIQLQNALSEKQDEVDSLSSTHQLEFTNYESQLAKLSSQLEGQQHLVDSQKQQISILQNDIDNYNMEIIRVASLEPTAAGLIDDTPTIEIIDPPVTLTRSTPTVQLRPQLNYRDIIGKVSAPAGLLSLTINGISEELEDYSLFKTAIPINNKITPVEVVAIDVKGRRVAVNFSMQSNPETPSPTNKHAAINAPPLGNYYALIIGNNDYQTMSTLKTAINDAKETEKVLNKQYQFKTQLLINATRYQILSALNSYREKLQENDNLLIYYAGHGKLDPINKRGFWLPIDADETNSANWISNTAITDILNAMKAKHVLVVADSCYSGSLSQTAIARVEQELDADVKQEWIKVMSNTRARIMLTSGGIEPVMDGGGGKHSVFAKAFIDTLRDNNSILEGYSLYYEVLTKVMDKTSKLQREQVPQYAPIHLAGHESGEFLFSPKI